MRPRFLFSLAALLALAAAVAEAQQTQVVKDRFFALGMVVAGLNRAQFAAELNKEADFWSDTIKRGNITIR